MIPRAIKKSIVEHLRKGKVIVLYGARQVGKTTVVKDILADYLGGLYLNCEHASTKQGLSQNDPLAMKRFFGDTRLVVLDEAQVITDIGLKLKILIDAYPELQIIATGSSAFDLAHRTSEPLTGRAYIYHLHPLSLMELVHAQGMPHTMASLDHYLRFGLYPEIAQSTEQEASNTLQMLTSSYLYKDVLMIESIKKSPLLEKLLKLLAFQVGSEVSYGELADKLGVSRQTIMKYIDVFEQLFIVVKIGAFSRNLRNELTKSIKVYFRDIGIRNALINSFQPIEERIDKGAVRENFCIIERLKRNQILGIHNNYYFRRTYAQQEIDLIEERDTTLHAIEFKYSNKKTTSLPEAFAHAYPRHSFTLINRENCRDYLTS